MRLAEEIAGTDAETFVVSCEDLTEPNLRVACAKLLAELATRENMEVDVVGFVRPQWQLLESEYAQQVTGGRTAATFSRFVEKMLDAGERTILDYRVVFAPYRARFGDRVRVFPLQASCMPQGLIAHFLSLVGAETAGMEEELARPYGNKRYGAKVVEVSRLVCARLRGAGTPKPLRPRLLPKLPTLLDEDAPFTGFSRAEIRQMEDRFVSANAAFAHEGGISTDGTLFQDAVANDAVRPNIARWEDFSDGERHRVRRFILERIGVDLDASVRLPRPL